ncbi:MAG: hypothetical protein PHR14_10760 [Oscillospiraceae bacterium]|nr:hypothetical protein [Oscillospiraceae bacterium]
MANVVSMIPNTNDKYYLIKQNWWHIEPIFSGLMGDDILHKIRQIMDIYLKYDLYMGGNITIPLKISSNKFLGLRVYARNLYNNEIAFISDDNNRDITLSLPKDQSLPTRIINDTIYYHLKLEIEYIVPNIDNKKYQLPMCKFCEFLQSDIIQPEFYITAPLGWRIKGTPTCYLNVIKPEQEMDYDWWINKINYYQERLKDEKISTSTKQWLNGQVDELKKKLYLEIPINIDKPMIITTNESKYKYNYIPNAEGTMLFNKYCQNTGKLHLIYAFEAGSKIKVMSVVPIIFMVFGLILLILSNKMIECSSSASFGALISYAILILAYYYTYISMRHNGYQFISNKIIRRSICISGGIATLNFLVYLILACLS